MADVITIDGGDGVPPEPNWHRTYGRKEDREAASAHWKRIVSEMRAAEKLTVANAHAIERLIFHYVSFDMSAKAVMRMKPVLAAPKTRVPSHNPWWTTMSNAASQAAALEKELCISPRDRGSGAKVEKKTRRATGADTYLKPRSA